MSEPDSFNLALRYWRERAHVSRQKLADALGVHHNTIQKLENGERKLTMEWLDKILPHIGVSDLGAFAELLPAGSDKDGQPADYPTFKANADELMELREKRRRGENEPDHSNDDLPSENPQVVELNGVEYCSIGRYDARFSAGPGSILEGNPEPEGFVLAEGQWLRALTTAAPANLAVVRVDGDSMSTTLLDGDWVLVDRTQRRLSREGIYCIQVHESAWIKRLSLNLKERLVRIISDNPAIPMQEIEEEYLNIFGRIIAVIARRVP